MHLLYNYPLQHLNSFRLPACAKQYICFQSIQDVEDFCVAGRMPKIDFYILGGGSNTLFVQAAPACILHASLQGIEVIQESMHGIWVQAGAGVAWDKLVSFCVSRGYAGIENLSGIPGTVGAAPIQNIGAYGVELKEVLYQVEAIELCSGTRRIFSAKECAFEYRNSIFKTHLRNKYFLTSVVLSLQKTPKFRLEYAGILEKLDAMQVQKPSLQAVRDAVVALRQQKLPDPVVLGNAGSFFKNPLVSKEKYTFLKKEYPSLVAFPTEKASVSKLSAAWLIAKAGFKGFRAGKVGISPTHALVLVQYGGATGQEVWSFALRIQEKVKTQWQIELEPEVTIV